MEPDSRGRWFRGQFYAGGQAVGAQGEVTHFTGLCSGLRPDKLARGLPPSTGTGPITLPFYDKAGKQMHEVQVEAPLKEARHLWETKG